MFKALYTLQRLKTLLILSKQGRLYEEKTDYL